MAMILTALWHTLVNLALVATPVLVGYLAGRHARRRHLDQVELQAWDDGFRAGLIDTDLAADSDDCYDPDELAAELDIAMRQAHTSPDPTMN